MNSKELYVKSFQELSLTIQEFNKKQSQWDSIINFAKVNHNTDFSVLLNQEMFNVFNAIHESKEKVLSASFVFLKSCENISELDHGIVDSANKIRDLSRFITEIKYSDMFINYGTEINKFVEFLKSTESAELVNKLEHSLVVYQKWCDLLVKTNEIRAYIDMIDLELLKISIFNLKQEN